MLCLKHVAENICIAGDMNTDLSRLSSWHTQAIKQFVEHEDMHCVMESPCADVDYTYINTFTNTYSIIDHFFVSTSLIKHIESYYSICDEVENNSDHQTMRL